MKRILWGLMVSTVLMQVSGAGAQTMKIRANASTIPVTLQNFTFVPANLTIMTGDTVVWTNSDGVPHTVTSGTPGHQSGLFNSGIISDGGTYERTFTEPGVYAYFCTLHTTMTGTITVDTPTGITERPSGFALNQNTPNPFNGSTVLAFDIPRPGTVTIAIYGANGQRVWEDARPNLAAGRHHIVWTGTDTAGMQVASGVYLCTLDYAGWITVRRMLYVR